MTRLDLPTTTRHETSKFQEEKVEDGVTKFAKVIEAEEKMISNLKKAKKA